MLKMRAGLLRIALAALACQLAGVPALAVSAAPSSGGAGAVMPCCQQAGPDHVCPMMHRTARRAPTDRDGCRMSAGCPTAPAATAALGLVLLAPPAARFALAPGAGARPASGPAGSSPACFAPPVPAPPPWA